jgi:hypothetical protein
VCLSQPPYDPPQSNAEVGGGALVISLISHHN